MNLKRLTILINLEAQKLFFYRRKIELIILKKHPVEKEKKVIFYVNKSFIKLQKIKINHLQKFYK